MSNLYMSLPDGYKRTYLWYENVLSPKVNTIIQNESGNKDNPYKENQENAKKIEAFFQALMNYSYSGDNSLILNYLNENNIASIVPSEIETMPFVQRAAYSSASEWGEKFEDKFAKYLQQIIINTAKQEKIEAKETIDIFTGQITGENDLLEKVKELISVDLKGSDMNAFLKESLGDETYSSLSNYVNLSKGQTMKDIKIDINTNGIVENVELASINGTSLFNEVMTLLFSATFTVKATNSKNNKVKLGETNLLKMYTSILSGLNFSEQDISATFMRTLFCLNVHGDIHANNQSIIKSTLQQIASIYELTGYGINLLKDKSGNENTIEDNIEAEYSLIYNGNKIIVNSTKYELWENYNNKAILTKNTSIGKNLTNRIQMKVNFND